MAVNRNWRGPAGKVKRTLLRGAQGAMRPIGLELLERSYHNPLPEIRQLPAEMWTEPRDMPGVDLGVQRALVLLGKLRPYIAEFRPPLHADAHGSTGSFYLANGAYESVDAESLYGLLRYLQPKYVLELGSGATSHVIDFARRANTRHQQPFTHEIVDPFPFGNAMGPVSGPEVRSIRAEALDPSEFEKLESGDVLFVDTTHTVKTGGDVVHLILEILPRLASGVYVHVHDIFLPYEYPREWVTTMRRAWAEQYMLQAFLAFNPTYEVIFPAQAVARAAPDQVREAIPSFRAGVSPGAFWLRRT
jgi:Methyltransferase domain